MSRVGVMPIVVPNNIEVSLENNEVILKNKDKVRSFILDGLLNCCISNDLITLSSYSSTSTRAKVLLGTSRSIINNMVIGLSEGFSCYLTIVGVGYKAESDKEYLTLHLGFSHAIKYKIPKDISIECSAAQIKISSCDKQKLYTIASYLCGIRKYNPYKGKGLILKGKYMIRKEVNKKK